MRQEFGVYDSISRKYQVQHYQETDVKWIRRIKFGIFDRVSMKLIGPDSGGSEGNWPKRQENGHLPKFCAL